MKEPASSYVVSHNDVIDSNFNTHFPEIIKKLNNASHVAVDLEFTALGNAKSLDMNHRYAAMKKCVESASIASIGLSIFQHSEIEIPKPPLQSSLSDLSNLRQPTLQFTPTDLDHLHMASSQPIKKATPSIPASETHTSSSQPTVPSFVSVLSKEEEEALISSFLDEDDDEFHPLPTISDITPNDPTVKETTTAEFSLPAVSNTPESSIISEATTASEISLATNIEVPHSHQYECDNFNILTLKRGTIAIETSAATFLVEHGYSFDKLFTDGIPFTPRYDMDKNDGIDNKKEDNRLKNFWKHLISVLRFHKIPLILHNGLYDMIYIYHSFIGKLPNTFKGFLQVVSDSFPFGIYDTRYLANQANMQATFLSYVFGAADRLRQNRFTQSTLARPYFEVKVNDSIFENEIRTRVKRKREFVVEEKEAKKTTKGPFCKMYSVSTNFFFFFA